MIEQMVDIQEIGTKDNAVTQIVKKTCAIGNRKYIIYGNNVNVGF